MFIAVNSNGNSLTIRDGSKEVIIVFNANTEAEAIDLINKWKVASCFVVYALPLKVEMNELETYCQATNSKIGMYDPDKNELVIMDEFSLGT